MCIFSGPVADVSNTKIFTRLTKEGEQVLVYQNEFVTKDANAMILPIPESTREENAVEFINMEDHEEFFDDLFQVLNPPTKGLSRGIKALSADSFSFDLLKIETVGSFEASYVPTVDDFDRLDERFVLDKSIWANMPQYKDFGFVVFQFKPGKNKPHPMAFKFKSSRPEFVYFPTVHIHDGKLHGYEKFDHTLYVQSGIESRQLMAEGWSRAGLKPYNNLDKYVNQGVLGDRSDIETHGLLWCERMNGILPNKDVYVHL